MNSLRTSVFLFLLLVSSVARTETCRDPGFSNKYKEADVIFAGEVISREKDLTDEEYSNDHESCGGKTANLKVMHSWKGSLQATQKVYSWDGCGSLGSYFEIGEHYLVFAKIDKTTPDVLSDIGGCYTDSLANSVADKTVRKLNRKTDNSFSFENEKIIGSWKSFQDPTDKPFEDVDGLELNFKKNNVVKLTTLGVDDEESHKGGYYVYENRLAIGMEESMEFNFSLSDNLLVIESIDRQFRYTLKRH